MPPSLSSSRNRFSCSRNCGVRGTTRPSSSTCEQICSISSTAPLQKRRFTPLACCSTIDIRRLVKSNGISSIFLNEFSRSSKPSATPRCKVEQVLQSCLKQTVEVGILQDAPANLPVQVHVLHQDDVILCERSRLVGAQNIHGTEVLNGVELFDDALLARHGQCATRQIG